MIKRDFYSGEPTNGSPGFNVSTNMSRTFSTDPPQEMVYQSDPNLRYQSMQNIPQQPTITPGQYGYNSQYPYYNNPGFQGYVGSPAGNFFNGMNPPTGMMQPYQIPGMNPIQQYQDRVVHVPGFNPFGGQGLFPTNIEEICNQLQLEMMVEQEEAVAERNKRMQGYFNSNFGSNYYGMPYYSNYVDFNVMNKYKQKAAEIRQEAINKKLALTKRLARAANSYLDIETNEEELSKAIEGYDYVIPGHQIQQDVLQAELSRMVPISNQNAYVKHHNEVRQVMQNIVGNTTDMNDFLRAQGPLTTLNMLEEEMHNRRDGSQYYQGDAYRRLLFKSIRERNKIQGEEVSTPVINLLSAENYPTLSQSGSILEDGTISITAPAWLGNRQMLINNEMEKHFEENRNRFLQSIYAQDNGGV